MPAALPWTRIEMKAVLQRSGPARVEVQGRVTGRIKSGLVVLLGVEIGDTPKQAKMLAEKTAKLRLFPSDKGGFDLDLAQAGGAVLAISQFTLMAETKKGRRPSFSKAAGPEEAEPLYQAYCGFLRDQGLTVEQGVFGAMMEVHLINSGPVTILLEN